jgi:hypothetical protein
MKKKLIEGYEKDLNERELQIQKLKQELEEKTSTATV